MGSYMGECISCGERGTGSKVQSYIVCYLCQLKQSQADLARLRARVEYLEDALRQTHANYCTKEYTERGLHAPECLLYEVEDAAARGSKEGAR